MFKLALDAGHYLKTEGKRCMKSLDPNETREWWLNDRVADYVMDGLKEYEGYSVVRTDDTNGSQYVSLDERVNKANSWGADFFLSIHHNAGVNGGKGGGIVAYAFTYPQAASLEWRDELYTALIKHTGLKGDRWEPKTTGNYQVLRDTAMPAVLLELGYMDSQTDVPVILTDEYARKCAKAIVEVIVRRGKLTKKRADAPDAWAADAWAAAQKKGVLDGTRPRDNVTRQELAVVLNRLGLL